MKLEQLTFTRYLAALTVVFFHFGQTAFPTNIDVLNPLITAGPIAVCYFFVLSGFIMAVAYYKPEQQQTLNKTKYWVARLARIYPVYLLALAIMMADALRKSELDALEALLSISMLQAWIPGGYPLSLNSPGWSLSVEAFFYLSFPFLLILAQRISLTSLMILSIMLWIGTQALQIGLLNNWINGSLGLPDYAGRAFMQDHTTTPWLHDFIYYNPLMHLNTFVLGFVVGMYFVRGRFNDRLSQKNNTLLIVGSALFAALLIIFQQNLENALGIHFAYNNGLITPLFILFIVVLALDRSWISQWLSLPSLILLGEASYSLYILQRPIYGIYKQITAKLGWLPPESSTLHFYIFIVLLTLLAIISYKLFETPMRRFINSWYSSSINMRQIR